MVPSMKTLERLRGAADKCTRGDADEILQCLRFALEGKRVGIALQECNVLLDGHGVELLCEGGHTSPQLASGGDILAAYVNLGDTYATTILYDYVNQRFHVTSWGDWYERYERRFPASWMGVQGR